MPFGVAPDPPACPSGLALWTPVAWYPDQPDDLWIFRKSLTDPQKWRVPVKESDLNDAWDQGAEYVLMKAKLRPAVVVSTVKEHDLRHRARLVPIHTVSEGGFYQTNQQAIQDQEIPGLYWIDGLRVNGAIEPRVADCTSMVKVPLSLLAGRERIGILDPKTLLALKEFWAESVVL